MNALVIVANFLISILFNFVVLVLWLRIIMRYFRVSHLNPLSKIVYQFTNPWLGFVESHVYSKASHLPRYDWVCLAAIALIEAIKFTLLTLINFQAFLPLPWLLLFVMAAMVIGLCNLLFYALLLRVVLSWLKPHWEQHPMAPILIRLTEPAIALGHKILPNISGFDFSPFLIMVSLKVITLFVSSSMPLSLL